MAAMAATVSDAGGGGTHALDDLDLPDRELVASACAARERAHAPYSGHRVGAAARTGDGAVHPGCNIENSSYGLTVCAERVALFASRAAGATDVRAVAIVGPGHDGRPTPPCGACRQVLLDLAPGARIILSTPEGAVETWSVAELLPRAFGPDHLDGNP